MKSAYIHWSREVEMKVDVYGTYHYAHYSIHFSSQGPLKDWTPFYRGFGTCINL